jgi:hypothetical protein
MKHKKGSAQDRRREKRAEAFGTPGRPTQRQQALEAVFTRDRDPERGIKADVRELERREFDPATAGIIQTYEPPGPPPERRK